MIFCLRPILADESILLSFMPNNQLLQQQYIRYKKLVDLVYWSEWWRFLVQNTLLQLIFFIKYISLLSIDVFSFKMLCRALAFFISRYSLLQLSLWDSKDIDNRIKCYQYYRNNPVKNEKLSYFLINTNCRSSKKL